MDKYSEKVLEDNAWESLCDGIPVIFESSGNEEEDQKLYQMIEAAFKLGFRSGFDTRDKHEPA